jgi:hypothetical protein
MQRFRAFMAKYYPAADISDGLTLAAYSVSTGLIEVLKRCGDDLTRENVMKVVADLDFVIDTYRQALASKPLRPIFTRLSNSEWYASPVRIGKGLAQSSTGIWIR